MSVDKERSSGTPVLQQRWVRVSAGLSLLGMSVLMAVAALRMPFVEIHTAKASFGIDGSVHSGNLNLVLVATGTIGALLGLYYAVSSARLRATFFVVGGVGAGFTGLLMIGAYQTIQRGAVSDPAIYARIKLVPATIQIGTGLWTSLVAAVCILGIAVVVLRSGAPPKTAEEPKKRRRF
ncbi:MAG: hypothetical protein ABI333_25500 [bacterium]